jgi:hypothetical protein
MSAARAQPFRANVVTPAFPAREAAAVLQQTT